MIDLSKQKLTILQKGLDQEQKDGMVETIR